MKRVFSWQVAIALALFLLPFSDLLAKPEYKVDVFPSTCAKTATQEAYDTRFLQSVWQIQQGKGDWLVTTRRDYPQILGLPDSASLSEFKRLISHLNKHGTKLLLVYPPTRGVIYPDETNAKKNGFNATLMKQNYLESLNQFRQLGVHVPRLEKMFEHQLDQYLFYPRDTHWSQDGAIYAAQLIAEQLATLGFTDTGDARFETSYSGIIASNENVQNGVERLCDYSYPRLYVNTHVTTEINTGNDLFGGGEKDDPTIVLLGTSFSAQPRFNFAGYLQQYANIPIVDYSVIGGGIVGAWINYLKSGDFERQKPDLIIWEVPGWWQFESRFLHSILPLFHDGCSSSKLTLHANHADISPVSGKKNALFSTDFTRIPSKRLLFDLSFDTKTIERVKLRAWFASGGSKTFTLRHHYQTENDGRFLGNFGADHNYASEGIVGLDIEEIEFHNDSSQPKQISAEIKVCPSPLPYAQ